MSCLKGKDSCFKEKHKEQTLSCSPVSQTRRHTPGSEAPYFTWDWEEQRPALVEERAAVPNANIAQPCERARCLGHMDAIHERIQTRQDQGILSCFATLDQEQTQRVTKERHGIGRHARTPRYSSLTMSKGNCERETETSLGRGTTPCTLLVASCPSTSPPATCPWVHVPGPAACRDALSSARLPRPTLFANIHFFVVYHETFFSHRSISCC